MENFNETEIQPIKLKMEELLICDPLNIDHSLLINTPITINSIANTINNLTIDINSPRVRKALEILDLQPQSLDVKEQFEFRKPDEPVQITQKRYFIHYLQVARLRKQVILQRNKLKNEDRIQRKISILDQSTSSLQPSQMTNSEYFKNPTEIIEYWIETHFQKSRLYNQRLSHIKQYQEEQIKEDENKQIKFVSFLEKQSEKKRKRRLLTIQEKKNKAKEHNSKSTEILVKMNQLKKNNLEKSILKQERDRQSSIDLDKRMEELKQQNSYQIEERMQQYNIKQTKASQHKVESDLNKSIITQLELLKTERNTNENKSPSKMNNNNIWSVRLPQLLQNKKNKDIQQFESNLAHVVQKICRTTSQMSIKSNFNSEDEIFKSQQQKERYNSKQEYYQNRGQMVKEKLKKKNEYLDILQKKKQEELDYKFKKIKDQIIENENRYEEIKQQLNDKLTQQLEKQVQKNQSNKSVFKQRELAVEELRFLRKSYKATKSSGDVLI